ncbi:MAG: hypothetical protein KF752_01915 [Pirellulaceae bacterium]|nr:hypothetical protein [Pirellulaceae bacterium]
MRVPTERKTWLIRCLALAASLGIGAMNAADAQQYLAGELPSSVAFPGPAPMEYGSPQDCDGAYGCDSYIASSPGLFGFRWLGDNGCGAEGCRSSGSDGFLGGGPCGIGGCPQGGRCGVFGCGSGGRGCSGCGPASCLSAGCAGAMGLCGLCSSPGSLLPGHLVQRMLGPLAPYSEGTGSQRWFDVYAGTIALARNNGFGGISSPVQDLAQTTAVFEETHLISTIGTGPGTPALYSSDLDLDKLRYGLELIGNIQTGPGTNVEVRYFGLNKWSDSRSVRRNSPDLFSVFSEYGTNPGGVDPGFDDTDRSFIHTISYDSKIDNGEVNFRRRWMAYNSMLQGSWLGGIRYLRLNEKFGFAAVGSQDNTFTFDQLRFFNMDTKTNNDLVGFQIGADVWLGLIPGISLGNEVKAGVYNNWAKVDTSVVANSVPGAREVLRKESAAFLVEYSAQAVYRLTYAWTIRGAYNLVYVDEVALAPENFNARDMSNALNNSVFGINRFPFIDADGHAFYKGYSVGAEFLW